MTRATTKIYGEMQCPIVHSGEEQRKNYGGRATDDLARVKEELTGEGEGAAREALVPTVAWRFPIVGVEFSGVQCVRGVRRGGVTLESRREAGKKMMRRKREE